MSVFCDVCHEKLELTYQAQLCELESTLYLRPPYVATSQTIMHLVGFLYEHYDNDHCHVGHAFLQQPERCFIRFPYLKQYIYMN